VTSGGGRIDTVLCNEENIDDKQSDSSFEVSFDLDEETEGDARTEGMDIRCFSGDDDVSVAQLNSACIRHRPETSIGHRKYHRQHYSTQPTGSIGSLCFDVLCAL